MSGLRFSHDDKQVSEVRVGDEALDPARDYPVPTNSMLADGGHNCTTLLEGTERAERGSHYQMIADWINQRKK